jgi:hypothetical protein
MAATVSTAQPRQTRSINSSSHVAQAPLSLRPVLPQVREAVAKEVEGLLGTEWRISHRFNETKDGHFFRNETIYAWKREGRERPGLLIIGAAQQPAIYWDMDRDEPYALRFQVPFGMLNDGYIALAATLLRGERRLILEDVWVHKGRRTDNMAFSARWRTLCNIYQQITAQQLFLGFEVVLTQPRSLQQFLTDAEPGTIWDFQPESGTRRRIYYVVPGARVGLSAGAQVRAAEAAAHIKLPPTVTKNVLKKTTQLLTARFAKLRPDKTTTLPDAYILESADGVNVGRASVTKLAQSQELRAKMALCPNGFPVEVAWHSEFKKYEILRLLPTDSPLTSTSSFFETQGTGAEAAVAATADSEESE